MKATKYFYLLLTLMSFFQNHAIDTVQCDNELKLAILGLGGRSQYLLLDCLKLNKNIRVVAVCDDYGLESFNFFTHKLDKEKNPLLDFFRKAFENTAYYPDNNEGLQKLFDDHKNIDLIFITSANYNHLRHANAVFSYSACKNIYIEKPLFINLEEFNSFLPSENVNMYVGLTLRYSTMAKIVVEKLQKYKVQLGSLKRIKSWEHVRFCQALTNFMMSWRRHISLSGGLLLEKCIHDLDLALFFLQSLNIDLQDIYINTKTAHNFFKKSHKQTIIDHIANNEEIKKSLINRDRSPFQRYIDFKIDAFGNIDWPATIDRIFENFPEDDSLDNADIICDYHKLIAVINPKSTNPVDFELEVNLGGFQPTTTRGINLAFEHGIVEIDVMKSYMIIALNNGSTYEYNLQTNNSDHADGDTYIAHTLLGSLPEGQYKATVTDPIVLLSTIIGLASEDQALHKNHEVLHIKKIKGKWVLAPLDMNIPSSLKQNITANTLTEVHQY